VAIFISPGTVVYGQKNYYRKSGNEREGANARETRSNLRDRHLMQDEMGTEATMMLQQWRDDFDSYVDRLEDLILAEVQKKKPCAWGFSVLGETLDYKSPENVAFPAFDSNYWITPIKIKDLASSTIKVTGMPPAARYYSFQTYTLDDQFSSVVGALTDVDVTLADDGSFTILINDGEDTGGGSEMNSMRGLPEGSNEGIIILMYRTYLSVPLSSPAGGVDLPRISVQKGSDGELDDWRYCGEAEPIIEVQDPGEYKTLLQLAKLPEEGITYFRSPGRSTPFPNNDIGYLTTDSLIYPVKGYAVVARGKAPTFLNGDIQDIEDENPQVRYWSMCKMSLPSTKTGACLTDVDATLDSQGRYVIVVASDRPSGTGFDYLNFGPGPIGILALRNMLPSEEFFPMSVQNATFEDGDSGIREKLKEFYPETVYCKIATIEDEGVEECF
jgi:hypothetical protein